MKTIKPPHGGFKLAPPEQFGQQGMSRISFLVLQYLLNLCHKNAALHIPALSCSGIQDLKHTKYPDEGGQEKRWDFVNNHTDLKIVMFVETTGKVLFSNENGLVD